MDPILEPGFGPKNSVQPSPGPYRREQGNSAFPSSVDVTPEMVVSAFSRDEYLSPPSAPLRPDNNNSNQSTRLQNYIFQAAQPPRESVNSPMDVRMESYTEVELPNQPRVEGTSAAAPIFPIEQQRSRENSSSSEADIDLEFNGIPSSRVLHRQTSTPQKSQPETQTRTGTSPLESSESRGMVEEFQRTHYSEWFVRHQNSIIVWYKFLTLSMVLDTVIKSYYLVTDPDKTFLLQLAQVLLWLTAVLAYLDLRRRPKYLLMALFCIQINLLLQPIVRSLQTTSGGHSSSAKLTPEERALKTALHNARVFQTYFVFTPLLFNSILISHLLEGWRHKVMFVVLNLVVLIYSMYSKLVGGMKYFQSALIVVSAALVLFGTCYGFSRALDEIESDKFKFMLAQNKDNDKFKRIIDAVDDAMLVVKGESIEFRNKLASSLFTEPEEELLNSKQFYLYQQNLRPEDSSSSATFEGVSLAELVSKKVVLPKQQILTRHFDIASCTSMAQAQMITKKLRELKKEKKEERFDFFMIKLILLPTEGQREVAIQITDVSIKIFNDSLRQEQRYLTLINTTISHEIRNPINSMTAQIVNIERMLKQLKDSSLNQQQLADLTEIEKSSDIVKQSILHLDFNVENIVSLPKLKDSTFQKNIQSICILQTVNEVAWITCEAARQRNVDVETHFCGFDSPEEHKLNLDKKRVQQVLLNYLTNAIKFNDKVQGRVLVLVQYVPSKGPLCLRQQMPNIDFRKEITNFFTQCPTARCPFGEKDWPIFDNSSEAKLVISVLDNGAGILPEKQKNLYHLFSEMRQGKDLEARGIGLGLVISNLVTTIYDGETQLLSQLGLGSIFSSSFSVPEQTQATLQSFEHLFQGERVDTRMAELVEADDRKAFIQFFLDRQNKLLIESCRRNIRRLSSGAKRYNSKRILIIDDEPFNCLAIQTLLKSLALENLEARVDVCMNGRDALRYVLRSIRAKWTESQESRQERDSQRLQHEHHIIEVLLQAVKQGKEVEPIQLAPILRSDVSKICDYGLILTDCSMPFMDGYECTQAIRKLLDACGIRSQVPRIVAITGHFEPDYQLKAICSGMEQIYSKPVEPDLMAKLLLQSCFKFAIPQKLRNLLL